MNDITRYNSRLKEPALPRSSLVAWALGLMLLVFVLWANFFSLDEVTTAREKLCRRHASRLFSPLRAGSSTSWTFMRGTSLSGARCSRSLTARKPSPACRK
ncbi:Uncharacterised protein [Cedecea neteri]|uniref:Uncharacterized protein n=1 Tax=Cedecea neteri TaxID=158822 RepID=A0A2X3J3X3_9ENTR|nr:Uncharacterised protein [Cedecea neteri]